MDPTLLVGTPGFGQVSTAATIVLLATLIVAKLKPAIENIWPLTSKWHDPILQTLPWGLTVGGVVIYRLAHSPLTPATAISALGEGLLLGLGSNGTYGQIRPPQAITPPPGLVAPPASAPPALAAIMPPTVPPTTTPPPPTP